MGRKAKKAAENTVAAAMKNDIAEALSTSVKAAVMSASLDNNNMEVMVLANSGVKYVTLNQLYIIKDYIDDKAETLLDALVASDSGVHGLRYKDGKLQHQNPDGTWSDITTDSSGGSDGDGLTDSDFATDEEVRNIFKNT